MNKEQSVQDMTDTMAKFTSYIGKRLPNDVKDKLAELRTFETNPLAKAVYTSMAENQEAADKLDRPSCQDTGVIQYFIKAGRKGVGKRVGSAGMQAVSGKRVSDCREPEFPTGVLADLPGKVLWCRC